MPRKSQLKWQWKGDVLERMSAVQSDDGLLVCGSFIMQQPASHIGVHKRIVEQMNRALTEPERELLQEMFEDAQKWREYDDSFEAWSTRCNLGKYRRLVKKLTK